MSKIMIRILAFLILFLALSSIPAMGQISSGTAQRIIKGSTLPAACAVGDVFFKTSATVGSYQCTSANTWEIFASGGGSGTVTNTGTLTSGKVILGNAGDDIIASKVTLTNPATTAVITILDNKTFTVNHTLTLAGTVATVMTFPTTSATIARTDAANTFTGVQTMTSPSITTSLVTGSTTFALLNTVATTINFGGVATALNIGAGAETILNFGGFTTASQFRFLEPSGSGTNYSAFKAVAQGADITYSLPPTVGAAGTVLTDVAGNGVLTWAAGGGGAPGGADTQVQFNDASAFGGDAGLTYNKTTNVVTITAGGLVLATSGTITQTSASATAFESGPNGGTNPVLRLVNSTGSQATGLSITGLAAAGGVTLTAISSGSDEAIRLVAKGTGSVIVPQGAAATPGLTFNVGGGSDDGFWSRANGLIDISHGGAHVYEFQADALIMDTSVRLGWDATGAPTLLDTALSRNGIGIVEINNGTAGQWGSLKLGIRDAGTTTVTNGLTIGHQSSGTPAAGLGSAVLFNINSTTTADQEAAQIAALWTTATHASRTADLTVSLVNNAAAKAEVFRIKASGLLVLPQVITAAATTGNQTIQTMVGTVNVAATGTTVTVTNATVTTSSQVFAVTRTNDTVCSVKNVVPGAGSFVINLTAACNAETSIGWWIINN